MQILFKVGFIMIPTVDEIKEIIEKTKHANIDIKQTISKTISSGWMHEDYFVLDPGNCELPYLFKLDGLEYELLSDAYFDYVDKMIDDEGAYIALAYASDDGVSMGSETIKHNVDGLDEDEIFYAGIITWCKEIGLELSEESVATAAIEEHSNYGILVTRNEGRIEISYAYNEYENYGPGGSQSIYSIEDSLENPVFRLVIKLMSEAIVLKDE